jgi:hypothetical protein
MFDRLSLQILVVFGGRQVPIPIGYGESLHRDGLCFALGDSRGNDLTEYPISSRAMPNHSGTF